MQYPRSVGQIPSSSLPYLRHPRGNRLFSVVPERQDDLPVSPFANPSGLCRIRADVSEDSGGVAISPNDMCLEKSKYG